MNILLLSVIFVLWILLQLALDMSIFKNPLNYCVAFIIVFFTIQYVKSSRS
ncbi:hypothetical protein SK066_13285 [Paenibacillus hunanensis]|nr:hypothetical protein [Paenibacillus hunanensis]WPP43673.1 hypothetical protein SK066_13285 [Paenibacillus hunanensis]